MIPARTLITFGLIVLGSAFWGSSTTESDVSIHMPQVLRLLFKDQGASETEAKLLAQSYVAKYEDGYDFKKLEVAISNGELFKFMDD